MGIKSKTGALTDSSKARSSKQASTDVDDQRKNGGSFLTKYFMVILFLFACLSLVLNSRFTHPATQEISIVESHLKDSIQSIAIRKKIPAVHEDLTDDHKREEVFEDIVINPKAAGDTSAFDGNVHTNFVAGLNCEKFGGPSEAEAQEMVYWEDIPEDAKWVSPFHSRHHKGGPTQFLTFEPDQGGWNNIR